MSDTKLFPCPFCGGEAEFIMTGYVGIFGSMFNSCQDGYVICKQCGIKQPTLSKIDAIKSWNTRKPMERIVEQLERLELEQKQEWEKMYNLYTLGQKNAYKKAIEIVKAGGKDD